MQTVSTRRDMVTVALMLLGIAGAIWLYNVLPPELSVPARLTIAGWSGVGLVYLSTLVETWPDRRTSRKAYGHLALAITMWLSAASNYLREAGSPAGRPWSWTLLALHIPLLALAYSCLWRDNRSHAVTPPS